MNSRSVNPDPVPTPELLRRGLSVIRAGRESVQRYIVRDAGSGKQKILTEEEFFILDQLSACQTLEQLEEAYEARFGSGLASGKFEQILEAISALNLWGRSARDHPLVGPSLSNRAESAGGRRRRRSALRARQGVEKRRRPIGRANDGPSGEDAMEALPVPARQEVPDADIEIPSMQETDADRQQSGDNESTETREPVLMPGQDRSAGPQADADFTGRGGAHRPPGMHKKSIFPQWKLFRTGQFLRTLAVVLPLRGIALWSIPFLLAVSGFILSKHTANFIGEFDRIVGSLSFFVRVALSMVTINLLSTTVRGLAAYHYGMPTFDFGVRLILWFLPRFILGAQVDPKAPRDQQAWVSAAPLLTKLFLLGLGIVCWFLFRATDSALSHFFICLAAMGAASFILTAIPLFPASGYQLLTILTNEPMLRQKALGALKSFLTTGKMSDRGGLLLMIFGLLTLVSLVLLLGFIFYIMGNISRQYFQTTGILFVCIFAVSALYQFVTRSRGAGSGQETAGRQVAARRIAPQRAGGAPGVQRRAMQGRAQRVKPAEPPSTTRRLVKYALLAALIGAMFIPYSYETGGELIMVPLERQDITTDVSGIIDKIYYEGGESLAKGALIAQLNVDDAKRQINIHDARIKEQQAVIDRLLAKPTAEELDVAVSALKVQQTRAEFSARDLARKEAVFEKNVISQDEIERARREHQVDLGNVVEAEATVALVKAGATPEELLAAEAELARWVEERNLWKDIYEKSFLYMPINGKLTTQFLRQKLGQYLNKGEVFAEVENTSSLLAEIEVPEFDASLIRLGAAVRVRAWAFHEEIFRGEVVKIDTNVEERSFGNIVKVVTRLDNSDGRLKSGMTGYAKISGETRPVWEVLFLTIVRFVEVEMWSWIP